jgi:hypothetical protein
MNMRATICLLPVPESEMNKKMEQNNKKGKIVEAFVFVVLLVLVISTLLYSKSFFNKISIVFFVVLLLIILLSRVRKRVLPESRKVIMLLYLGASVIIVSIVFSSIWAGYCEIAGTGLTPGCMYSTYVLCGEVTFLFVFVIFLFKRGRKNQ